MWPKRIPKGLQYVYIYIFITIGCMRLAIYLSVCLSVCLSIYLYRYGHPPSHLGSLAQHRSSWASAVVCCCRLVGKSCVTIWILKVKVMGWTWLKWLKPASFAVLHCACFFCWNPRLFCWRIRWAWAEAHGYILASQPVILRVPGPFTIFHMSG